MAWAIAESALVKEISVTLVRQDGSSDDECKRFLWCLGRRLEVGLAEHVPEPAANELARVDPRDLIEVTVQAEELAAARKVVLDAAGMCVDSPTRLYDFALD